MEEEEEKEGRRSGATYFEPSRDRTSKRWEEE